MTRMTGPDCVVMCNLINTYIHTYIHIYIQTSIIDPTLGGSMRVAQNDSDDRAGLRGYVQFNKYTYIQAHWLAALLSARCGRHAKNSGTSFKLQRTGTWRCSPVNSRSSSQPVT